MTTLCSESGSVAPPTAPSRTAGGSALLGVLALMLLVSALGATLLTYLAGSSQGMLVIDSGNQAFFLAESGARYAIARIIRERQTAVASLNGQRFTLSGGRAFDLAIEVQVEDTVIRYCIDSTGITGLGTPAERRYLNGYAVEMAPLPAVLAPVGFYYGAQVAGSITVGLGGGAYIDSFNSDDPSTYWSYAGQYNDASVAVDLDVNAATFNGGAMLYGDLLVGENADMTNPTTITNNPSAIQGDVGIVPSPPPPLVPLAYPEEAAEVAAPSPLTALPSFTKSGTPTVAGGNYTYTGNLDLGKADLTLSGSTYLRTTGSLTVPSNASLLVNGNFSGSIGAGALIKGDADGLKVLGSADLQIAGDLTFSSGSGIYVRDTLDLDISGNLSSSGGPIYLGGESDIDIQGSFTLGSGASVYLGARERIRVGNGLRIEGNTSITFAPNGYLFVHVESGAVEFVSTTFNSNLIPSHFLVVCDAAVTRVEITSTSTVYAGIYAPSADVTIGSNASLFGALVCKTLTMGGNAALHVDQAMLGNPDGTDPDNIRYLRRMWVAAGD